MRMRRNTPNAIFGLLLDFHGLPTENLAKAASEFKNNKPHSLACAATRTITNRCQPRTPFFRTSIRFLINFTSFFCSASKYLPTGRVAFVWYHTCLLQIRAFWIHLQRMCVRVMTQEIRTKSKLSYEWQTGSSILFIFCQRFLPFKRLFSFAMNSLWLCFGFVQ